MRKQSKRQLKYFDKIGAVLILMIIGVLVGGVSFAKGNPHGGGGGSGGGDSTEVYMNPSSGTYAVGSTVTVSVRENSSTVGVYTEQVGFTYPSSVLQFQSIDASTSGFPVDTGLSTGGNGHIELIRGSTSALTGDQEIANVNFTVLADGNANFNFDPICQLGNTTSCTTVYDVNSQNTVTTLTPASYRVKH